MKNIKIYFLLLLLISISCDQQADEAVDGEESSQGITLTTEQIEKAGIQTSILQKRSVLSFIKVTGEVSVPPNNLADIHMIVPAYVRKVHVLPGDVVRRGDPLVDLYHPDIVRMQTDYQTAQAELEQINAELVRKKQLDGTNIVSEKDLLDLRTRQKRIQSTISALTSSLQAINISPQQVLDGRLSNEVRILASIAGTVSEIGVNKGMLVSPTMKMLSIVDTQHKHLELNVYPSDARMLEIGMDVLFTTDTYPEEAMAEIYLINKNINEDNLVLVHCHLKNENKPYIIGDFAQAKIIANSDSVYALNDEEIINEGGKSFVFFKENDQFIRQEVITGISDGTLTEVKGPSDIFRKELVISGNYYLNANW